MQNNTSHSSTLITYSYIVSGKHKSPASTRATQEYYPPELPSASILDHLFIIPKAWQNPKKKKAHLELSGLSAEADSDVIKPLSDMSAQAHTDVE